MADSSQINCPHCGQAYFVQPEQWPQYLGQAINCTRCGREFCVTPPTVAAIPAQADVAQYATTIPYAEANRFYSANPIPTSGWAIASLLCGIFGFCVPVLPGIFAIVAGSIGLSQTKDGRRSGRGLAVAGFVLGIIGIGLNVLAVVSVLIPAISRTHQALSRANQAANAIKSTVNMRDIGSELTTYALAHQDRFPPHLADILNPQSLPLADEFIAPNDSRTAPSSASAEQMAADLSSGSHCSYVYVGNGLGIDANPRAVILYESLELEHLGELNVLFTDGSVETVPASDLKQAIKRAKGGPIILSSGGSSLH